MSKGNCAAFTFLELCIVVAVLIVLAAVFFPVMYHPYRYGSRINCTNNLKQIGIAAKTWALDNNDCYPMQVSTNNGGTFEFVSGGSAFLHFAVMSNELSTPRVLLCPADQKRRYATNFFADFMNSKISYFMGIDAVDTNASRILCGDRNITNGLPLHKGLLQLDPSHPAGWTYQLHEEKGNILLSDGSVQQVTTARLRALISASGTGTNRLAMP